MPVQTPIADTLIPQQEVKAIPVRVVSTKPPKTLAEAQAAIQKAAAPPPTNQDQPTKGEGKEAGAETTPPATAEKKPSVILSEQLSATARKEQAFRKREQEMAAREKQFELSLENARKFDKLQEAIKSKNFADLEAIGLKYEDFVNYKIESAGEKDPNADGIKELKGELAKMRKEQEEKDERAFEETKAAYRTEIRKLVEANPEFSSIKESGQEDGVLEYILDTWEEDGAQLSVEEACKHAEEFIIEQGKSFLSLSKLKTAPAEPERKPLPKPQVRTITNDMSATGDADPSMLIPLHKLPEAKRIEEARRRIEARKAKQGA